MTQGYDPHRALFHIFHQREHGQLYDEISPEERATISSIVGGVTEKRSHPDDLPFHARFAQEMLKRGQGDLPTSQIHLAQGLIECLNDYQAYSPWTNPENIRRGIYDHFKKGGVYLITGFSTWVTGDAEEPAVEYLSMTNARKFSRTVKQWCEVVEWPDRKYRSRFVYRGPDLNTPPA